MPIFSHAAAINSNLGGIFTGEVILVANNPKSDDNRIFNLDYIVYTDTVLINKYNRNRNIN